MRRTLRGVAQLSERANGLELKPSRPRFSLFNSLEYLQAGADAMARRSRQGGSREGADGQAESLSSVRTLSEAPTSDNAGARPNERVTLCDCHHVTELGMKPPVMAQAVLAATHVREQTWVQTWGQ